MYVGSTTFPTPPPPVPLPSKLASASLPVPQLTPTAAPVPVPWAPAPSLISPSVPTAAPLVPALPRPVTTSPPSVPSLWPAQAASPPPPQHPAPTASAAFSPAFPTFQIRPVRSAPTPAVAVPAVPAPQPHPVAASSFAVPVSVAPPPPSVATSVTARGVAPAALGVPLPASVQVPSVGVQSSVLASPHPPPSSSSHGAALHGGAISLASILVPNPVITSSGHRPSSTTKTVTFSLPEERIQVPPASSAHAAVAPPPLPVPTVVQPVPTPLASPALSVSRVPAAPTPTTPLVVPPVPVAPPATPVPPLQAPPFSAPAPTLDAPSPSSASSLTVPRLPVPPLYGANVAITTPLPPPLRATEEEPPREAVVTVSLEEREEHLEIPDYTKWLYPVLLRGSACLTSPATYPLASVKVPHVLASSPLPPWCEADVLGALPATLPPEFVMFGGARYSGAPLDCPRPPSRLLAADLNKVEKELRRRGVEADRLQFLVDQLKVAKVYLKIEARRISALAQSNAATTPALSPHPVAPLADGSEDVLLKPGEEEELAKASVWTTAYFGTPQQLYRVLTNQRATDGLLSTAGHLQYHRRRWGIKKSGETFVLGLGMKATPLQFAAVAGRLDSVVMLLTHGARDNVAPRLKDILTKESMAMVASIFTPPARPTRPHRPVPDEMDGGALEGDDEAINAVLHSSNPQSFSTFVSEEVVSLDERDDASHGSGYAFYDPPIAYA